MRGLRLLYLTVEYLVLYLLLESFPLGIIILVTQRYTLGFVVLLFAHKLCLRAENLPRPQALKFTFFRHVAV
jgi:hypothetical protein